MYQVGGLKRGNEWREAVCDVLAREIVHTYITYSLVFFILRFKDQPALIEA